MIITIDGPVASGKSTIARILAKKLGYYYVYSGILYRALGYILVHEYEYTDAMLHTLDHAHVQACFDPRYFTYMYDQKTNERVLFKGVDITSQLKTAAIDLVSSAISKDLFVRHTVTQLQRSIAAHADVVVDGRDTGSVVFPHAECKFFLTASIEVRARRWAGQQAHQGNYVTQHQAQKIIGDRDRRDMHREYSPLVVPQGAVIIDSSDLNVDQTVEQMMDVIKNKRES
jgi:cytidylate kinase